MWFGQRLTNALFAGKIRHRPGRRVIVKLVLITHSRLLSVVIRSLVVILMVQQGVRSEHYTPGPLAQPHLEGTLWDFYQYLARHLTL